MSKHETKVQLGLVPRFRGPRPDPPGAASVLSNATISKQFVSLKFGQARSSKDCTSSVTSSPLCNGSGATRSLSLSGCRVRGCQESGFLTTCPCTKVIQGSLIKPITSATWEVPWHIGDVFCSGKAPGELVAEHKQLLCGTVFSATSANSQLWCSCSPWIAPLL